MCKTSENENATTENPPAEQSSPPTVGSSTKTSPDDREEEAPTGCSALIQRLVNFYFANEFLLLIVMSILLARAYPPLGADYLQPKITATWIAVILIFIMAGLGLKTEELSKAFQRLKFNLVVQVFNFGVVSGVVYGVSRLLEAAGILSQDLADGMVVGASLPMTINMVLVLTKASGGDEAAAIFNAAAGNMTGVFLSPLIILGYLGVTGDVDLVDVFLKLAARVVAPVAFGQILQKTAKPVVAFYKKHKKRFKKLQEYCLVFIVYTVFCRTFEDGSDSSIGDIFLMIIFQFLLLTGLMGLAWYTMKLFFPNEPKLRVMGLYGCTHKTVAMGVPLINAIYEDNAAVGLYTLPLLIWHPMQLVIGTFLAPRLSAFVEREKERLGITDDENDEDKAGGVKDSPMEVQTAEEGRIASEELDEAAKE